MRLFFFLTSSYITHEKRQAQQREHEYIHCNSFYMTKSTPFSPERESVPFAVTKCNGRIMEFRFEFEILRHTHSREREREISFGTLLQLFCCCHELKLFYLYFKQTSSVFKAFRCFLPPCHCFKERQSEQPKSIVRERRSRRLDLGVVQKGAFDLTSRMKRREEKTLNFKRF